MSCDLTIAFKVKLEWKKAISDRQNNYELDEYLRIPRRVKRLSRNPKL